MLVTFQRKNANFSFSQSSVRSSGLRTSKIYNERERQMREIEHVEGFVSEWEIEMWKSWRPLWDQRTAPDGSYCPRTSSAAPVYSLSHIKTSWWWWWLTDVTSDDDVSLTHRTGEDEAERIRDPAVPVGQFITVNYISAHDLRKQTSSFINAIKK